MEKDKEQQLIRQMKKGNERAFETLLSFYQKAIWNHLLRFAGDKDDASDIAQDTFIKVYEKRAQIDETKHFKNWLYTVATNTAYDFLRKKKRLKQVSLDDEYLSETIEAELPYTTLEADVTESDLQKALLLIPPHYRTILLLYYKEGFQYDEIAAILSLPLNTVKTHMRRAREALATLLKKTYG